MPLTFCGSAPKPGRTLFMAFAYHGADRDDKRRGLLERFESAPTRGHRIVHRDHYANPRSLPYLIAMIAEAAAVLSPHEPPDLVLDRRYEEDLPEDVANSFGRVITAAVVEPRAAGAQPWAPPGAYDNVVLVYPDALGLGCESEERDALNGRQCVFVINGRRRMFRIDRAMRARLGFRRFLARTRVVERGLAWLFISVGSALAVWDRAAGNVND